MVVKPSSKEEEFFAKEEAKKKKELEKHKQSKMKSLERQKLKELHYMKCPKCGMDLKEISYFDVKIDQCTECEGVWLDHGELDTLTKYQEPGFLKNLFSYARDSIKKAK